jgi:hypothetical protein
MTKISRSRKPKPYLQHGESIEGNVRQRSKGMKLDFLYGRVCRRNGNEVTATNEVRQLAHCRTEKLVKIGADYPR